MVLADQDVPVTTRDRGGNYQDAGPPCAEPEIAIDPARGLVGQVAAGDQSYYQNLILILIKYFYMVLIGGLIGFMIVHQILDYIATRRELRSKGRH